MALSAKERKAAERERNKLDAAEKEARLLSRQITTKLYHNTDAALKRAMARVGIEEDQDFISRLIHGADRMNDEELNRCTSL